MHVRAVGVASDIFGNKDFYLAWEQVFSAGRDGYYVLTVSPRSRTISNGFSRKLVFKVTDAGDPVKGAPMEAAGRRCFLTEEGKVLPALTQEEAAAALSGLDTEFFEVLHVADPFSATQKGVAGFDALVPDPSRAGSARTMRELAAIEQRVAEIDPELLDEAGRVDHAVLTQLASGARSDLEHSLWEANVSAGGYVSPQAMAYLSVPAALITGQESARAYLSRLGHLGGYFDEAAQRYAQARADGRISTEVGVRQAIDQIAGHLARDVTADTMVTVPVSGLDDESAFRAEAARLVTEVVRPAAARLLAYLESDQLPVARSDEQVGIRFVPGGSDGYLAAVRRHTTTWLSPDEIHQIGLDLLAELRTEWSELGASTLGLSDFEAIVQRLREDLTLRFSTSGQIVAVVTDALGRAEAARDDWFPHYDIPSCVVEEIDPVEAGNAPLAYYRPPAAAGLRPGAHCVLTADPASRFRYEYEALAFHESTPGHHLQIASNQTLTDLPAYRRYLDAEVCAYVEGWGLYCERLADEMGLYTSDLMRLGMLSFDALRACRLVVDTGMHHLGWSRSQAIDFMWANTATTRANVINEIDRYIAWPGQALAYMIGRRELQRLRACAEAELGSRFDIRAFHGVVLGSGAVPLAVLENLVLAWARR